MKNQYKLQGESCFIWPAVQNPKEIYKYIKQKVAENTLNFAWEVTQTIINSS